MNLRAVLHAVLERLAGVFLVLGTLLLLAAAGVYLVLGRLDQPSILLFSVGMAMLVYAALERPKQTVQALSTRKVRYGTNTVVMSAAMVGILILVNILANRFSTRLDLTQDQLYTLSPLSLKVVNEIKQPVHLIAFYQNGDGSRESYEDLLKEYVRHSNLISYEFVDPQIKPGVANLYQVKAYGTTVLIAGDKQQSINGNDESSITSALLKIQRGKAEIAYYLTGHGELDFTNTGQAGAATAKSALEAQNFEVKPLNLASTGKVPDDASLVIVAGPSTPLIPSEIKGIEEYLDQGGKAIFLVDKRQRDNLQPIADRYGVDIGNGVIVEAAQNFQGDALAPLISRYQLSPVTKDLPRLLFVGATSVSPKKDAPTDLTIQPLAQTTEQSWLETDSKVIHYDEGLDPIGPLSVALSVTKAVPTSGSSTTGDASANEMRIVFIGNLDFASNAWTTAAPGNTTMLTNAANWLTSNEDLIQIRSKAPSDRMMLLSNVQLNLMLYGSAVFLPLLVLGVGTLVWWNRR